MHTYLYIYINIFTPTYTYSHMYIYICMYVYDRFYVCMVHVLFKLGLNLSVKVLSFICS